MNEGDQSNFFDLFSPSVAKACLYCMKPDIRPSMAVIVFYLFSITDKSYSVSEKVIHALNDLFVWCCMVRCPVFTETSLHRRFKISCMPGQ